VKPFSTSTSSDTIKPWNKREESREVKPLSSSDTIKPWNKPEDSAMRSPSTPDIDNKPWNKRELALQQLEREEAQARQDYEQLSLQRATAASGFSQVSFPLTPAAEEAIKGIQELTFNWVQLSLDNPPKRVDVVTTKTITPSELSESVNTAEPQFYLYRSDEDITLIYCCPEQISGGGFSQTIKNRMVYSTCKATLANSIKELGLTELKKFDIRDPNELTEEALKSHLNSKVAAMFTGSELKGSGSSQSYSSSRQPKAGSLAGLMASTGTGAGRGRNMPKGVVLPPPGAYC